MIHTGDVLDILPTLPENSAHGCLCDPPYGLSFMGKHWDHGVPGVDVWREVSRVLRPGAHLLAFGGSGSEMIGGMLAGWSRIIGIEREPDYVRIAEARLAFWEQRIRLYGPDIDRILESSKPDETSDRQSQLFR